MGIRRRSALWATAILAAAAMGPALAGGKTHVVIIENMVFTPATLTVKRGDSVVWRNKDVVPHTATTTGTGKGKGTAKGRFDSGNIAAGKSWTHAMRTAGRFDYICNYHLGMKASLEVQ